MSSLKRISEELRVLGETDLADQVTALFDKLGNDLSQTRWYTKREPKKILQELKALGIPATFEEGWDYSSPHGRQYLYTVKVNPKNRRHVKELQRIKDQVLGETDLADQVEAMLNPVGNMLDIILDDTRKAIYFADAAHLEEPAIKLNTAIANLNDLKKPFKCKYYLSNTASYVEAVGSMAGDKLIIEYTFEDTPVKAIWSITPFKKPVLLLGTTVEFEETDSDLADQKG